LGCHSPVRRGMERAVRVRTAVDSGGRGGFNAVVTTGMCHQFIDYCGEARADILPFLPNACQDVLEVGCGRGPPAHFSRIGWAAE
jgi:hypothetical protein